MKNIYVGGLAASVTESTLKELFEKYGTVSSVKIIKDKFTGQPRGFGFVEMPDESQALAAISALNNTMIDGKTVNVNEAREREGYAGGGRSGGFDRNRGGGGGNRGGGSGFGRPRSTKPRF